MSNVKNNIFDFATKELSQDAVICWMLGWARYPESELHELALEMFKMLGVDNFDEKQDITIKTQVKKADIVVALHGQKKILIIEDKVYSSEHDNQIEEYRKTFGNIETQALVENKSGELYDIWTVYFKTGYYYDEDKIVIADKKVDADQFYKLISEEKYRNKSEILDMFIIHLEELMSYYTKYGDFTVFEKDHYYISSETIAQHNLMREIFPQSMWDEKSKVFMVEVGSSSGRPWTEMNICEDLFHSGTKDAYKFFWRVDTDKEGPYLSLRLYDWFATSDESKKERHTKLYKKYLSVCHEVVNELGDRISVSWDKIENGYRGNYVEASLMEFHLKEYITNWPEKGESLINDANLITKDFLKRLESER